MFTACQTNLVQKNLIIFIIFTSSRTWRGQREEQRETPSLFYKSTCTSICKNYLYRHSFALLQTHLLLSCRRHAVTQWTEQNSDVLRFTSHTNKRLCFTHMQHRSVVYRCCWGVFASRYIDKNLSETISRLLITCMYHPGLLPSVDEEKLNHNPV